MYARKQGISDGEERRIDWSLTPGCAGGFGYAVLRAFVCVTLGNALSGESAF
jgi:hypothetical protein